MTILYPALAAVKSPRRTFAAGIVTARPARPFEPTLEERAWWAAECARIEAARLDRHYDDLAGASAALDSAGA